MGKLTFKGEAPKKKKKHTKASRAVAEEEEELDAWVRVPFASLALGPIYITLPNTSLSPAICLALQPTTGKVFPCAIPASSASALASSSALDLDAEDLEAVVEAEPGSEGPTDVHHVWVCTRIPDTNDKVTFRSGTGKFLAADEVGVVSADREARGMQEEWTLENAGEGNGAVLRSAYGKLLSVDIVAGGKMELRADEETEGETERWKLWMQGEFVSKARKALLERSGIKAQSKAEGVTIQGDLASAEREYIQKYQARGQGRFVGTEEDIRELKKARKDGKLAEAMLERRVKLKADRYC